jgi:hypothetical protein
MPRGYWSAAVCRRGHVFSSSLEQFHRRTRGAEAPLFCTKCGAAVLTACEQCGSEIAGQKMGAGGLWAPPAFCIECAAPFPWLDRVGRIYLLENMLDTEDIDEATRLEVREELTALATSDVEEEEQVLWQSGQQILVSVVTAEAKQKLGLPPG